MKDNADQRERYMEMAAASAEEGFRAKHGGPFGALIARGGEIIVAGHNRVLLDTDPTAHAEIVVIREASRILGSFELSDCEIYSTCEPCPMCLAAILWARLGRLYYGSSREDAEAIGFADRLFYDLLSGKESDDGTVTDSTSESITTHLKIEQLGKERCLALFEEWRGMEDRVIY